MTSRSFYIKKNLIWQLLQSVIVMVFPLIMRTLLVYRIGDELLGFNSLCISVVSMLNVVNFGVDSVLIGRMYRPAAMRDTDEVCRQLKLCRTVYKVIGIAILTAGVVITPFLGDFIKGDKPDVNIYFVFLIYLLSTVLSYWLFAYARVVFQATQQVYYLNQMLIVGYLIQYGLQIVALFEGNYLVYVCFGPISTIIYNIGSYRRLRKEYPQYYCRGVTDQGEKRQLCRELVSCGIYRIRDMSRDSLDSMIISAILGLILLSKYQNYTTVLLVPIMLKSVISEAIAPSLGNLNVTAGKEEQFQLLKVLWLLDIAVSGFFSICYFQLIQNFIYLWVGPSRVLSLSVPIMLSIYLFVLGICDFFKMVRKANRLWEKGKAVGGIEIVANLVLNIVLVKWLGVFGIVLATVITIVCINLPYESWLIFKDYYGKNAIRFFWLLMKVFVWVIITSGIVWVIIDRISCFGFWMLVLQGGITVIVAGILFILIFRKDNEWRILYRKVVKKKGEKES